MQSEHTILCGGLVHPSPSKAAPSVALNLWGGREDENVQLHIDDLHQPLYRDVPAEFHDLVEIATYVYCADQAVSRTRQDTDSFGEIWRRRFHFHVPVRCPEFWNRDEIKTALVELIEFLSDDFFEFTFSKAGNPPAFQQYLGLTVGAAARTPIEQVAMFSGGIDSLAGAIDEVLVQRRSVAFVTHVPTAKNSAFLRTLEDDLGNRAPNNKPLHIRVRINKAKELGNEYTQRTRSFLFASLGCTVARMLGLNSLRFYENGVVSLNLPVLAQVVGGRATRTTHPRVLSGLTKIFSLIANEPFAVENPYLWETKGEVVRRIVDAGCGSMIATSVSCAHTWERTLEHSHCGACSQCIDRRFGIIAAGAEQFDPEKHYKTDLFTQSRPKDEDRVLMAAYVERARAFKDAASPAELMTKYPMVARVFPHIDGTAASVAQRVLDLHKRHAAEVERSLVAMVQRHAADIINHRLPGDCLIKIVTESRAITPVSPATSSDSNPPNFFWRRGNVWEIRFLGRKTILVQKHEKGCAYIQHLLTKSGESLSTHEIFSAVNLAACDWVLESHISPEELKDGFAVTHGLPLTDGGEVVDAAALKKYRERILALRDELADAKEFGKVQEQQRIEEEIDAITSQSASATAKGGRTRKLKDRRKNQRDAFRNSVNRAIKEIAGHLPELGQHLQRTIKLGVQSQYQSTQKIVWSFSPPRVEKNPPAA